MSQDGSHLGSFHLANQILCAVFCRGSPVLINVQGTILVQILKGETVGFHDMHAGNGAQANRLSALIRDLNPPVSSLRDSEFFSGFGQIFVR